VQWVNRPSGLKLKDAMNASQAREFAARMRGKVVSMSSPRKAAAPSSPPPARRPTAPPAAQPMVDDDIPF
jgi:hypothetical protein